MGELKRMKVTQSQCETGGGARVHDLERQEATRLERLHEYEILDTLPEREFNDLTTLAAQICGTPIALISLVDEQRQWFKARIGMDAIETPREISVCSHAIEQNGVFVVNDLAADVRFRENPLVTAEPKARFYAGAALRTPDGYALGTICVLDRVPRFLTPAQLAALEALSRQVASQIELRKKGRDLEVLNRDLGREIAERKQVEETLMSTGERYRHAIEQASELIYVTDQNGYITFANNSALEKLMSSPSDLATINHLDLVREDHRARAEQAYERQRLEAGQTMNLELPLIAGDGSLLWVAQNVARVEREGRFDGFHIVARDITRERTLDALTALPNRLALIETLERLENRERNQPAAPVRVILVAPDRLKRYADTHGSRFADELLKNVAERLRAATDSETFVARASDEEFAIVLDDPADESVRELLTRIERVFRTPASIAGEQVYLTVSFGIASAAHGDGGESLLRNAGAALFHAKQNGGNKSELFLPDMAARAHRRLSLESLVRRALERDELLLYYQPQTTVATGEISGMEALLRVRVDGGILPPAEFVAVAEELGLISDIDEWVLRAAARQSRKWAEAGLQQLPVAVNVSAQTFLQRDFVSKVRAVCQEYSISPSVLHLELTESSLMVDTSTMIRTLHELRELGIRTSIDDFGAGYSSLSYVRDLPVEYLKIDRAFIRDVTTTPRDAAIVHAIVNLAHSLELKVIAEGVETEEQLAFLRESGCDESQGYLVSRPVPQDEFASRFLARAA